MAKRDNTERRERIKSRNKKVEEAFQDVVTQHPKWKIEEQIKEVADQFDLAPATVEHILKGHYEKYFWKDENGSDHER